MTRPGFASWTITGAFLLLAIGILGGGLAVAPVLGAAGALTAPFALGARTRAPVAAALVVLAVFFVWAATTSLWSDYGRKENVAKLLVGVVLYASAVFASGRLDGREQRRVAAALLLAALWSGTGLVAELVTRGQLTSAHYPPGTVLYLFWRTLGHGASVLTVITPAVLALFWRAGAMPRAAALFIAAATVACGIGFGLTANLLGAAAELALAGLAAFRPRAAVAVAGGASAICVLFAPLLGPISHAFTREALEAMPLSWEVRVFGWRVVANAIEEAPLFGHGFDSVRLMSREMILQGETINVVRLHPHNAGLHIWYETGFVGAALATLAIALMTRAIAARRDLSRARAAAVAGAAGAYLAISLVGYGVWQEWWIATAFLAAAAAMLTPARAPETMRM